MTEPSPPTGNFSFNKAQLAVGRVFSPPPPPPTPPLRSPPAKQPSRGEKACTLVEKGMECLLWCAIDQNKRLLESVRRLSSVVERYEGTVQGLKSALWQQTALVEMRRAEATNNDATTPQNDLASTDNATTTVTQATEHDSTGTVTKSGDGATTNVAGTGQASAATEPSAKTPVSPADAMLLKNVIIPLVDRKRLRNKWVGTVRTREFRLSKMDSEYAMGVMRYIQQDPGARLVYRHAQSLSSA